MPEKDVDEQFAAIVARWDDEALGHDPYGDALGDAYARDGSPVDPENAARPGEDPTAPDPGHRESPEFRAVRDLSDLRDWPVADLPPEADPRPADPRPVEPRSAEPRATDGRSEPDTDSGPRPESQPDEAGFVPRGWRPATAPEDEHYVPPPPAPLPPSEDKHFWVMVTALVAGPLLFVYLVLFNRDGNGWWMMFALLVSIAGFVLLVLRQPLERDEDDDGIRL